MSIAGPVDTIRVPVPTPGPARRYPPAAPPAPVDDVQLTAAYCAERAAAAIHRAEGLESGDAHTAALAAAANWRKLAEAMSSNVAMVRPKDPRRDDRG